MRYIILFISIQYFYCIATAQTTEATISSIEITGAHKVDKDFILNRITTKLHGTTSWDQLNLDQLRLNRLHGIQHNVVELDTLRDGSLRVRYDIVGQKTVKPFIGIGRVKGNFWFQIGAAEYNLNHKNQTLFGYFQSQDGRPNVKLYFENPHYRGRAWGYNINAFHNASIEPLLFENSTVNYRYDLTGLGLGGINHFGLLDRFQYSMTIFHERFRRVSDIEEVQEGPPILSQLKLLSSVGYIHDKVNFDFFYRRGFQHQILLQSVNTIGEDLPFINVSYEGRHYWRPSRSTNIAGQIRIGISTNHETPFAPFVLDSDFNLRGVSNRIDRTTAQFVINIELRQTLFHNPSIAVQLVGFSDSGSWRTPGRDLNVLIEKENFRSFIGAGARVILTKVFDSVLRLDYGVDVFDKETHGMVLGFGQFF